MTVVEQATSYEQGNSKEGFVAGVNGIHGPAIELKEVIKARVAQVDCLAIVLYLLIALANSPLSQLTDLVIRWLVQGFNLLSGYYYTKKGWFEIIFREIYQIRFTNWNFHHWGSNDASVDQREDPSCQLLHPLILSKLPFK